MENRGSGTNIITLENVSKTIGEKELLHDITLNFEDGKTHVLLGSSGSGKSTLLRLMMGLTFADAGHIRVLGIEISRQTQKQIPHRVGYVIQEGGLFPHLTAADNVALVARIRGWPRQKIRARLDELKELMGLDQEQLERFPRQLSGGQKQRVGLMRALMLNPPLLLLDEPFGALDPIVRSTLQEELKRIFNNVRKTVILVTHDLGEAAYFAHTVTLLHNGRLVQNGTLDDLWHSPAHPFVTEFINAQKILPEIKA